MAEGGLFDPIRPNASNLLRDRYGVPPFSVLDRKHPDWINRDNRWKALGIESEVGRDVKTYNMNMDFAREDPSQGTGATPQTSVFSPTLCELAYRWYSAPGQRILDPFAGGSVRGVVAGAMARDYLGVELRAEQVAANREQAYIAGDMEPSWIHGDSADIRELVGPDYEADLVFSCPPYAHLEKYSDDPADLSTMSYPDFLDAYRHIIRETTCLLRPDRFAVWMVGEVRDKKTGAFVGLVPDTIQAFRDAGLHYWGRHVVLTPIGTAAVRTPKQFDTSRKPGNVHEVALVFVKGDGRRAAEAARGDLADDPAEGVEA